MPCLSVLAGTTILFVVSIVSVAAAIVVCYVADSVHVDVALLLAISRSLSDKVCSVVLERAKLL